MIRQNEASRNFFRTLGTRGPLLWLMFWFGASACIALFYPTSADPQLSRSLTSPEWGHFLGFDPFGRDLQISVLRASLRSAIFASLAVGISCACSLILGASLALLPQRSQFFGLRILESFLAFPSLLLALAWAAIRGPGWMTLEVSILIGILPSFTRLVHARSREILAEPFILATESLGASPARVLRRHVLPQLFSLCAIKAPLLFSQALMAEATLSFLGVGAPVGHETWGSLLASGNEYLFEGPHIAFSAGVPLTLTVLSLQILAQRLAAPPVRTLRT